jgi:hypothetical protein
MQPGKALHVALALWFWAGVRRSRQVAISMSWLKTLGADRYSGYRGLAALEGVGLISVIRHRGRKSVVTLLEAPTASQVTSASKRARPLGKVAPRNQNET